MKTETKIPSKVLNFVVFTLLQIPKKFKTWENLTSLQTIELNFKSIMSKNN